MNKFLILFSVLFIAACQPTVKVEAPDKPIRVDLNVKIEHKVKVQIDKDLDSAIKKNQDIF